MKYKLEIKNNLANSPTKTRELSEYDAKVFIIDILEKTEEKYLYIKIDRIEE